MMMCGHFHLLFNKCSKECLGKRKGQVWESPLLDHAFHIFVYGSFGLLCFWRRYYGFDQGLSGADLVTTMVKHGLAVNLSLNGGREDEVVEKQFWGGRNCLWLRVLEWSLVTLLVHRVFYFHVFAGMVCVDWSLIFFIFDYFGVGSILGVPGIFFPLQGHILLS
jgi:hypothetical protein